MTTERLKCRWCDYSVPKFYRNKKGETKSGFGRLQSHIEFVHFEEIEQELNKINERMKALGDEQV